MKYLIIVARTNEDDFPNYWAGSDSDKGKALRRAEGMLGVPMRNFDRCDNEVPTKVIVAKEIKVFEREG